MHLKAKSLTAEGQLWIGQRDIPERRLRLHCIDVRGLHLGFWSESLPFFLSCKGVTACDDTHVTLNRVFLDLR